MEIPNIFLKEIALTTGESVALKFHQLKRMEENNQEWITKLETLSEETTRGLLEDFAARHDYEIKLVTMPYIPKSTERGKGDKDNIVSLKRIGGGKRKVACLYDTIDGTWNEKAGQRFTVSSMLAFTNETLEELPELFYIKDFNLGVIAPHHGEGLYYAIRDRNPTFKEYTNRKDNVLEEPLILTKETNPKKVRCMIDLFTVQDEKMHDNAVDAIIPIIKEWGDFGRYYGSGVELMAMLGRSNTESAYGGYVGAHQKLDNLIAPQIILEAAGAKISDWNGNDISNRRLDERINVAMAANETLHEALLKHLRYKEI